VNKAKIWMVFLLSSGLLITSFDRVNISVASTAIMKDLQINAGTMGIVFSSFFWAYVLCNIPAGLVTDRFGPRKVYTVCGTLWSLATFFTGVVSSVPGLIAMRLGIGTSEAVIYPITIKTLNEKFESAQRGIVMGLCMAGTRVGLATTPLIIAWVINGWGWRNSFYFSAIISIMWVALWAITYPTLTSEKEAQSSSNKFQLTIIKKLITKRNTWAIVCIKFLSDYIFYMIITWLPGYLVMVRHFTILQMGVYASLPWVVGMISQPVIGSISDYMIKRDLSRTFARKATIVICQILTGSIVFVDWIESPMVAVWLLIFVVAVESGISAVLWTLPAELADTGDAGTLAGIMNTAGALAGILAPIVTGFIYMATGSFSMAFVIAGAGILLASVCVLFFLGEVKPMSAPVGS